MLVEALKNGREVLRGMTRPLSATDTRTKCLSKSNTSPREQSILFLCPSHGGVGGRNRLDLSDDPAQWFAVNSHHSLISSGVNQKAILAVDRNRLDVVE
jgi:hypothetical protein